jgi:hypothetical protein
MSIKPDKSNAVISLVGGGISQTADGTINYHDGQTAPSESEINAKLVELISDWEGQEYARNRASAFPSIGDQFDMQYHDQLDGTTTWKDAIAKVKSDNPKE